MSDHNTTPKTSWWRNKKIMIETAIILVTLAALAVAAYTFHWDLIGLSNFHTTTITTEVTQSPQKK